MHQQVVSSKLNNLWEFYFVGDINRAAAGWTPPQMFNRLFSEGTHAVRVLEADGSRGMMRLEVTGACFDGEGHFDYVLFNGDLTRDQGVRVLALIKLSHPPSNPQNRKLTQAVAKVLGIT